MEHHVRLNLATGGLVAAVALGVSLVVSVAIGAGAYRYRGGEGSRQSQQLTVKGSARQRITSDLAIWEIELAGEALGLEAAYEALARGESELNAYLAGAGVPPGEIQMSAISTKTHVAKDKDGHDTREILSYELRRKVTVTTGAVHRIARAAGGVTELLRKGIYVESSRPEYYYRGLPDLRVTILGEASKDARARAEEIARNSGCRVTEVRSVQMSPLQVVTPDSTAANSAGTYDTSTIDKDVTAVVSVTYGISGG